MLELMQKYNISIEKMMLIASLDNLTKSEIEDLKFIEDRIVTHLEE